jgi:SAM-dependent methyltransferase
LRLQQLLGSLDGNLSILNIGSGFQGAVRDRKSTGQAVDMTGVSNQFKRQIIQLDISKSEGIDIVGDAQTLPVKDASIRCVIAQTVLEHVKSPEQCVGEMHLLLCEGGVLYAEVPFIEAYHGSPDDYQRYTISGLRHLMRYFHEIEAGVSIGSVSALCWLLSQFMISRFRGRLSRRLMTWACWYAIMPLKYLDYWMLKDSKSHVFAGAVYMFAEKRTFPKQSQA